MHRLLIVTSLMFAACASSAAKDPATPPHGHIAREGPHAEERRITHPEPGMTCETVTPTGSLHERRKCRSDAEREQDREFLRSMAYPTASPGCDPAAQPSGACPVDPGVSSRVPGTRK
jgi:hypothetical protein